QHTHASTALHSASSCIRHRIEAVQQSSAPDHTMEWRRKAETRAATLHAFTTSTTTKHETVPCPRFFICPSESEDCVGEQMVTSAAYLREKGEKEGRACRLGKRVLLSVADRTIAGRRKI